MKILPSLCTDIGFAVTFFGWEKELVKKSNISQRSISRSEGTSGIIEDTTSPGPNVLANFDTRMRCFFVDWDDSKRLWLSEFEVEEEGLKTAILELREYLQNIA